MKRKRVAVGEGRLWRKHVLPFYQTLKILECQLLLKTGSLDNAIQEFSLA